MKDKLQLVDTLKTDLASTQQLLETTQEDGKQLSKDVQSLSSSVDKNALDLKDRKKEIEQINSDF
jgi:peptidoglycan hydrolase CwlO-like protein